MPKLAPFLRHCVYSLSPAYRILKQYSVYSIRYVLCVGYEIQVDGFREVIKVACISSGWFVRVVMAMVSLSHQHS